MYVLLAIKSLSPENRGMTRFFTFLGLFLCVFVTACGGGQKKEGPLTPMPFAKKASPPDSALVKEVTKFVKKQKAPPNSVYEYVRTDLNGDGLEDGIVLFKLPHTHWCGWDGCGMAVFEATEKNFKPRATISNVRGPIYVSEMQNQGWKDIIIRVSGTNMPDKNIVMKYDGQSYPQSPMLAPTLDVPLSALQTERFFL